MKKKTLSREFIFVFIRYFTGSLGRYCRKSFVKTRGFGKNIKSGDDHIGRLIYRRRYRRGGDQASTHYVFVPNAIDGCLIFCVVNLHENGCFNISQE